MSEIRFSVLMPTYNQCAFIRRAILSLMQQTYDKWELIIINDGCTDETEEFIVDYLADERITYIKNEENTGLGHALNQGLDAARYDYIAYLPSDDFYFPEHLESIAKTFYNKEQAVLVFSGMQFASSDTVIRNTVTHTKTTKAYYCLQLVQTVHKKVHNIKWIEREDFITEDLWQMLWLQLSTYGLFEPTYTITCFWTSHPHQRHRIISEKYGGGLNRLRQHYNIQSPIKLRVAKNKFINEDTLYAKYRRPCVLDAAPLKILIVGELAYNPERIYALEQAGHKLYAIWDEHPRFSFSTVGPLPFGHVKTIPHENWQKDIESIKPDIIYALLNAYTIPFVYDIVKKVPQIPFVWHFKEGPSCALAQGSWQELIYLYHHASGRIFINELAEKWFLQFLPKTDVPTLYIDGDLPKRDYFKNSFSQKLSDIVGGIHTVVTGRMIGISDNEIKYFAENDIHIHLYSENYHDMNNKDDMEFLAPNHFHQHPHVSADKWTEELSQYDAGWLHGYKSQNRGNLMRMSWDDLNLPARIATYAAAGIPLILTDNGVNLVASSMLAKQYGIGLFYKDAEDLACKLKEEKENRILTANMHEYRMNFSFDAHVQKIITLFKQIKKSRNE